jgi:aspartate/methionine/tyrosine aminotransferase
MERLTIIADTYLSVGAAPALALPVWLSRSKELSSAIRHHTLANLARLDAMLRRRADASKPAPRRLAADAGWYAVLQWEGTPAWDADELLKRAGVIVQPGALFDWPDAGALVVSLLSDRAVFEEATERMARL